MCMLYRHLLCHRRRICDIYSSSSSALSSSFLGKQYFSKIILSSLGALMMARKYDFVVFGASGFTGQFVVEEMARSLSAGENNRLWAVAGRSEEKLRNTLRIASEITGINLDDIPLIRADVSSAESLLNMAKQTKVILNCVGPYRFYGEPVVKAAVEGGAHHVDISGEPSYLEGMQAKYDAAAKEAGVYVIGACGWDSIPCEMGMKFASDEFDGTLNSAEMVVEAKGGPKGIKVHFGTFHSLIYGVANRNELRPIRQQIFDKPVPRSSYKLKARGILFNHEGANGWCLPFMGADKPVAQRTQYFNYHNRGMKPIQVQTYIKFPNIFTAVGMLLWGVLFGVMASFSGGRRLLEKYPGIFSFGLFSHEGPTREEIKEVTFTTYIFGNGWSGKDVKPEEEPAEPPKDKILCKVNGPDPGYMATSACMVASALTLLDESSALPPGGGVITPGAAFAKAKGIIQRLESRGITFTKVL